MDSKEAIVIITVTIIIALFAIMITPVEIEGSAIIDLDTMFTAQGGSEIYTMGLRQYFGGQDKIILNNNTSVSLGINKASVNWHIKTPIFGMWLFKDDINHMIGD